MTNSFEALFGRGSKKDEGKKTAAQEKGADAPEKEGSGLEKATSIKKEISEITQGRSLEDLSQDDLNAVLAKYKEMEIALGLPEAEPKGDIREQMLRAKEIMREDFFAAEQIEKAFGIKVKPEQIPEIPFKREDLERAKELGQFLILRVDKANDGKPLTMAKMNELLKGKVKDGTKALYSDDGSGKIGDDSWYKGEDFALKETPKLSWSLTSKEVISNSPNKNYLDQTAEIVNYLKNDVFKGKEVPTEFQNAIAEFEKAKGEIAKLMNDDWKKAAEKLEGLAITKLTRQTPAEALYDIFIYFQNKGERLLENMYTWTSRRASGGRLVNVGRFDAVGACVFSLTPDDSVGLLGVAFSRSL
ncbi:MAG: hypothetical protein EOM19_03755 [Candidatus Moranbacteria bacterium]|nr:hypothetical protein [Candidatus Moranbacteria bacterium]